MSGGTPSLPPESFERATSAADTCQGPGLQDQIVLVQTTADDRDRLESIARELIERHLAACVQISGPIASHYEWEGQSTVSEEWLLSAKTSAEGVDGVVAAIRATHPYQLPEILWQTVSASAQYAAWVRGRLATA